jgi:hypothetical protein
MKRGLWFMAGAGAGVYAMVRARRLKEAFTVDGLRDRWEAVGLGARLLRDDIARAQSEKETELRERFGLPPHGLPALQGRRGSETAARASVGRPARPPETEGTD